MAEIRKVYKPTPTMERFHASNSRVRMVMGPFGSGKSTGCVWEIITRAQEQQPNSAGIRRTRWAIVRQTYPELKSTTVKTWQEWVPDEIAPITWGSPITCNMRYPLSDGTKVDAEVYFLSLNIEKDVKKLLSLELTGAWVNEAREIARVHIEGLTGRIARFPAKYDGGPTWTGIILDTNPPHNRHHLYRWFEVEKPMGYESFKQPPALINVDGVWTPNPEAENIENHSDGYGYYTNLAAGKTDEFIKVYVQGEYGSVYDGLPVWTEYRDSIHCQHELQPYRGLPLTIGMDFGLNPSAAIIQVGPSGQIRVIDEVVCEGVGLRSMITGHLAPLLAEKYFGMQVQVFGDPSGVARAQTDERSCFDILASEGFSARPARTNAFMARRDAVGRTMMRLLDGEPGFVVSSTCKIIREGLQGGYRFRTRVVNGEERTSEEPEKTLHSHPCEALQYAVLGVEPESASNIWGDSLAGVAGSFRRAKREVRRPDYGAFT